jgi:cobalt-zinc-cadmium efflux system outer membrane protein
VIRAIWFLPALLAMLPAAVVAEVRPAAGESQDRPEPPISAASRQEDRSRELPAPTAEIVPKEAVSRTAMTLSDVEAIALQRNPTLARAAAGVEAARGMFLQAGLPPNPRTGYHGMEMGSENTAGQQGAFVSQEVITGGKLRWNRQVAAEEVNKAQWRLEAQRQRVLSDVRTRFYEVLIAQRRVELLRELARIAQDAASASQTLLDNGQGTENSLLLAENEADMAKISFDNARDEYLEAWRRMTAMAGEPALPPTYLAGSLAADVPTCDWESTLHALLANSPELAEAWAEVERSRAAVGRAEVEWVPDVELWAAARHDNASGSDVADLMVGFPVPLFNRNQGNVQAARAQVAMAQTELSRIELSLQERLATAFRRYTTARRTVERYHRDILPRAKKSLDFVSGGYRRGQVDFLTLLTSQKSYFQVELTYLSAVLELRAASVAIEGQLLSGGLEAE